MSPLVDPVLHHLITEFLNNRNEKTFMRIYDSLTPALYRTALSFMGFLKTDAEDAVQDTWLTAVKKLDTFEYRSSFKTWITGILINKCREKTRLNGIKQTDVTGFSNALKTETSIHGIDIENGMGMMSQASREVFVLHDILGFKHHEISEMLNIHEGTSKSQLFKARSVMKDFLK
jgi:RNA polymerase sigma factor (sigma-70 family)